MFVTHKKKGKAKNEFLIAINDEPFYGKYMFRIEFKKALEIFKYNDKLEVLGIFHFKIYNN